MLTTLVTAAGSAAASCALEGLRALGHRVIACDIYPREWNSACVDADDFFRAERASDAEAYVSQLLDAVPRYSLNYIIPLTDIEVDALCSRKAEFAARGCTLCVLDEKAARLCRDKARMNEAVRDLCDVIPTRRASDREPRGEDYPVMLKPLSGRSSEGQFVARSAEAYRAALGMRDDYIVQPYISGGVITVDVARDAFGGVRALARKELLRTSNGLGTTVRVMPGHPLEGVCARIAERAGIVGAVNMEFIEHGDRYYFLEVNPRFSGGIGFSARAGFDIVGFMLACHSGASLEGGADIRPATFTRRIEIIETERG